MSRIESLSAANTKESLFRVLVSQEVCTQHDRPITLHGIHAGIKRHLSKVWHFRQCKGQHLSRLRPLSVPMFLSSLSFLAAAAANEAKLGL